jgi:hypothetical protein
MDPDTGERSMVRSHTDHELASAECRPEDQLQDHAGHDASHWVISSGLHAGKIHHQATQIDYLARKHAA